MSTILVFNTNIIGLNPVDQGDSWLTGDLITPKHVVVGAAVETVILPADYAPGKYSYSAGVFTLVPVVVPVVVPQSVTRFQALAALSNAGLLAAAQSAVAASANPLVPLAWNNAQTFERSSPTIASMATALNLTSAQLDQLFVAAAKITA